MRGEEPSEHKIQSTLVSVLRHRMRRDIVCMSIPNGGLRHPIVGRVLKAEGLIPGSPDLVFALPHAVTFWMEMKRGSLRGHSDGGLSDDQIGMHMRLAANGHDIQTAYSVEHALDLLEKRGMLK